MRRAWFLGDSRINNFDYYKYDTGCGDFELQLDFTIQRGATVDELLILSQNEFKFKKQNPPDYIKVAVGINDFILRLPYQFGDTRNVFYYNNTSEQDVFSKLIRFKTILKEEYPLSLVGFATIPPVSLLKNAQYKKLDVNETELLEQQTVLNKELEKLNLKIKRENNSVQVNHRKGCRTVSFHNYIVKLSTKRSKTGKVLKKKVKYRFNEFYDGLHGKPELKRKWFNQLVTAVKAEIQYTERENESDGNLDLNDNDIKTSENESSSDSEGEVESWNFKRRKTE